MKRLLSTILTAPLVLSMISMQAIGASLTNASNTAVMIEIEAGGPSIGDTGPLDDNGNLISLTVPSVLPFIFNKNGTTTVPTDWSVRNYSKDDIVINNIYFEGNDDWNIHQVESDKKTGEYLLDKGKDYKTIEVLIGEADKNNAVSIGSQDSINNIQNISMIINGVDEVGENNYNSTTLEFKVYRTPFTTASNEYGAYTMYIDFGFYTNTVDKDLFNAAIQDKLSIYFGGNEEMLNDPTADDLSGDRSIVGLDMDGKYHIISDSVIYAPYDSSYLFANCEAESIVFGECFDTSKSTNLNNMFDGCTNLKSITLGKNFGQANNIPESGLFNTGSDYLIIYNANDLIKEYNFDVNTITKYNTFDKTLLQSYIGQVKSVIFDNDHSIIANSSAIDLSEDKNKSIFGLLVNGDEFHISSHSTIYAPEDCSKLFNNMPLESITFNNFDTSNVTDMNWMFSFMPNIKELDITNFNTSNVTSMRAMFAVSNSIESLKFGNTFDTSHVTDMNSMFQALYKLPELDISNFDMSSVVSIAYMFSGCEKLKELDNNFTSGTVYNTWAMFEGCAGLTKLDLSGLNTTECIDMKIMFSRCNNLETIIFGDNWSTEKVTNMSSMFQDCTKLREIDLSKFNTSRVTNMASMFENCSSLTILNLSTFDTRIVEPYNYNYSICSGLDSFANNCNNLQTIILNENFGQTNTIPKTNIFGYRGMFFVENKTPITVINANSAIKNYHWSTDNRVVTYED